MNMNIKKLFLAAVAAGVAVAAQAAARGVVVSGGVRYAGKITWLNASKKYVIETARAGGGAQTTEIKAADVASIQIEKPSAFDQAVKGRNRNVLASIVKEYSHLQWDAPAAAVLCDIYLAEGNKAEALKICEDIVRADPEAGWKGDLAPVYWRSLLANNRTQALERALSSAARGGDRLSSARALVMRGDIIMDSGKSRENARRALLDGYLRAYLLYRENEVASIVGGEAAQKAAVCFDILGQTGRAAEFRTKTR